MQIWPEAKTTAPRYYAANRTIRVEFGVSPISPVGAVGSGDARQTFDGERGTAMQEFDLIEIFKCLNCREVYKDILAAEDCCEQEEKGEGIEEYLQCSECEETWRSQLSEEAEDHCLEHIRQKELSLNDEVKYLEHLLFNPVPWDVRIEMLNDDRTWNERHADQLRFETDV